MKPGDWPRVEEIFQEALQRDPAEREAYVRQACNGDSGLQGEVVSLLADHQEGSESWAAAAAAKLISSPASLDAEQRLGPYEILAPIGAGGMGKVYRARDTRLKRDVAIKVCGAQFSERFEREARVIASLNHTNICQIYDVGSNFLVMELVEGENLSGPVPFETALNYARQIAEALEAAHEKGVVHRDLKPANVKVTPAGVVKVLDFGLAKAAEESKASGNPSDSPTMTMSATRAGMILGTAAYMSPEQARGATVDKRADIWAFGCVLYEMLTGKQAFHGETTSDILAAVLRADPDWTALPPDTPPRIRKLLRRCLERDCKQRLQAIGEARITIDAPEESVLPTERPRAWAPAAVTVLALIVALIAAIGWWRATRPVLQPLIRISAEMTPIGRHHRLDETTVMGGELSGGTLLALSPDGTRLAMTIIDADGRGRLATRRLDQRQFTTLSGAESATSPFFSPNGQWLAFFSGGKLKKIPVQGGVAVALCEAGNLSAGSWGDSGEIVAALGPLGGLFRVPSEGGSPTPLTELDRTRQEVAHRWPQVLPGSQAALFTSEIGAGPEHSNVEVVSLKTRERRMLVSGASMGTYLPSGHLVYLHHNTLLAAAFSLEKLAVTGPAQPVVEDVSRASTGLVPGDFTFSNTGTMVYISGKGEPQRSIFWLESSGKTQMLHAAPGFYYALSFSPDGKRLAFAAPDEAHYGDIWVQDVDHDTEVRLTSMPGANDLPVWTPDGKFVVFRSAFQSDSGYYIVRADGSSSPQRLTQSAGLVDFPFALSPDGKWLAIERGDPTSTVAIWIALTEFDGAVPRLGKAELFLRRTGFHAPAFSPDGHWLAYASTETGTYEVYVQPFSGPGGKTRVSITGGQYPTWSRDGRLFFLGPDQRIMVADYIANGGLFVSGKPRVWSEKRIVMAHGNAPFASFALAPDGKRFAVTLYTDGTAEHQPTVQLTFLLNFFDELRRRVPPGGQ